MTTPVWMRAVMVREGDDVVTRCCVVAGGEFFPIEVRVNVPGLIAQAKALGIDRMSHDSVGGFGSWLKKAVKKVTHSKVVKAVGSAVKKVASSPVAMIANPSLVLSAHTTAKAATGKGLVKGKLGSAIDLGTKLVAPAAAPAALGFVSSKAAAALGLGLRAVNVAQAGPAIANVAKLAQQKVNLGKAAAAAIASKSSDRYLANPAYVQQAAAVRKNIQKLAPALAKQSVQSAKVRASFASIADKARAGSSDARFAASVLGKSAGVLSTIKRLEAANAGGLPGLLITAEGRVVRAPKGRFLQASGKLGQTGTLYRGKGSPTLRGVFSAVSGWEAVGATSGWGGVDDPGDDIDGPFYPATPSDDRVLLDDYSAATGVGLLTP